MTANILSVAFDSGIVDRLVNRKVPDFVKPRILFKIKLIDETIFYNLFIVNI